MPHASLPRPIDALLLCAAVAAIATLDARSRLERVLPASGSRAAGSAVAGGVTTVGALSPGAASFAALFAPASP